MKFSPEKMSPNKYLTVFSVSWQNEFTYRLNFILWRFRNILRLLMTYFLWRGVFVSNSNVFGYGQEQMLTYVFMVLLVGSVVLSAPSADNIGGEIANGDLSNYLVKPLGYLKYWFTRDLASKALNVLFAVFEISVLWFFLRPELYFSFSLQTAAGFLISVFLAMAIYYFISCCARFVAFWMPENTWGLAFLLLVGIEILSGGIFPLDILPSQVRTVLELTPFPYLLYYPIAIFQGKVLGIELLRALLMSGVWSAAMFYLTKFVWSKGLKIYACEGR